MSNISKGCKSYGQKSVPAWRETTPEDSSDDEESTPQPPQPWVIKRGLISVTEGIRTLGLGSEVSSSPDSKPFWDPTGRNVSVISHDNRKGQAMFEQSSKQLTPLHIKAKVPKCDESSTSPPSPSSTCSAPSPCRSTPPSSPPLVATPPSSPPSSSPPPTPSPAARAPLSAQQQSPTSIKSHSLPNLMTASPAPAPQPAPQGFPQDTIQETSAESPATRKHQDEDKTAGASTSTLPALTVKVQATAPITLDTGMDGVIATTPAIALNAQATTQNLSGGSNVRVTPASASLPPSLTAGAIAPIAADSTTDAQTDDAPASYTCPTANSLKLDAGRSYICGCPNGRCTSIRHHQRRRTTASPECERLYNSSRCHGRALDDSQCGHEAQGWRWKVFGVEQADCRTKRS